MLAHIGGVPLEESLIYLVPPVAVVAWIYLLGRRERRDPPQPQDGGDRRPAGEAPAERPDPPGESR